MTHYTKDGRSFRIGSAVPDFPEPDILDCFRHYDTQEAKSIQKPLEGVFRGGRYDNAVVNVMDGHPSGELYISILHKNGAPDSKVVINGDFIDTRVVAIIIVDAPTFH